jgi:hypothetical protein
LIYNGFSAAWLSVNPSPPTNPPFKQPPTSTEIKSKHASMLYPKNSVITPKYLTLFKKMGRLNIDTNTVIYFVTGLTVIIKKS